MLSGNERFRKPFPLGLTLLFFFFVVASACDPGQSPTRPLSVCEVFRDAERLDGKVIEVRGLATVGRNPTDFRVLGPFPTESCRFRNTPEAAEIRLEFPSDELRLRASDEGGYRWELQAVERALKDLEAILKRDPKVRRVVVTARGLFLVRKYDYPKIKFGDIRPEHVPFPGTLEIGSLSGVQASSK